jgi:hypothetical protein
VTVTGTVDGRCETQRVLRRSTVLGRAGRGWARPWCCCVAVLLYCSCLCHGCTVLFLSSVIEVVWGCRPGGRSAALQSPLAGEIERAPCPGLPSITASAVRGKVDGQQGDARLPSAQPLPSLCPAFAQPGTGWDSLRAGILSHWHPIAAAALDAIRDPGPPITPSQVGGSGSTCPSYPATGPRRPRGGRLVLVAGLCRDPTCPANSRAPTAPGGTPAQYY